LQKLRRAIFAFAANSPFHDLDLPAALAAEIERARVVLFVRLPVLRDFKHQNELAAAGGAGFGRVRTVIYPMVKKVYTEFMRASTRLARLWPPPAAAICHGNSRAAYSRCGANEWLSIPP
jgi:hypothetical protein